MDIREYRVDFTTENWIILMDFMWISPNFVNVYGFGTHNSITVTVCATSMQMTKTCSIKGLFNFKLWQFTKSPCWLQTYQIFCFYLKGKTIIFFKIWQKCFLKTRSDVLEWCNVGIDTETTCKSLMNSFYKSHKLIWKIKFELGLN